MKNDDRTIPQPPRMAIIFCIEKAS
ncbi:uncharacterized protein METZ01_LOCUS458229 [marine metagenome]|uniref:Uncharacterized protein n=1 Tax=marine metagenome TaxID=408172 RepID=A0A383ADX4_9ZZZZ